MLAHLKLDMWWECAFISTSRCLLHYSLSDDLTVPSEICRTSTGAAPLHVAAWTGHAQAAAALLTGKAEVNITTQDMFQRTPLSLALMNGHSTMVGLLLGAKVGRKRWDCQHFMCKHIRRNRLSMMYFYFLDLFGGLSKCVLLRFRDLMHVLCTQTERCKLRGPTVTSKINVL